MKLIPNPRIQIHQMMVSVASCLVVLGKIIPFSSGSSKNKLYIPKRIPITVNINKNKAEQHNIKKTKKENVFLGNFILMA